MDMNDVAIRDARTLGAVLADFRRERGVDQDSLANQLGTYRPTLSRLENGHAVAQIELLFQIIRALDLEMTIGDRRVGDVGSGARA
jgi:HTH-type transcriptional regulator / antitoxin HipB